MSQVLELAQQGDAKAISALVNRSLKPQGITAKVICQDAQMKILLESLDIPDKENLTQYLIQGLSKIGVSIRYLEIYGKRDGQKDYAWTKAFQVEGDRFTPVAVGTAPVAEPTVGTVADAAANPFLAPAATSAKRSVQGMNQDDILAQAQQGNLEAIETIVRAALADKEDLTPLVELNGNCLKVTIETKQFLDGQAFCGEFGTKMNVLAGGVIQDLEIYKRKSEKTAPFLMKKVTLFTAAEAEVASAPPEALSYEELKSRPNGQSSAMRYTEPSHTYVSSGSLGRPTGVLVVAILYFVFGGFCVVAGGFTLIASFFLRAAMNSAGGDAAAMGLVGFFVFVMAGILLLLGLARIWIGMGLLNMSQSARVWALRLEGISAVRSLFALIRGDVLGGLIGIGISVPIFVYLSQGGMADRFH
jgi:hypothetical protein